MSLTIDDITTIIQWLHLTIEIFLALLRIIGSIGIFLVFSHPKLYQSTCSRYIIAGSIFDLIQIITIALPNFLLYVLQIETFSKYVILCKLRVYFGTSTSFGPYFCLYMSLFDRWTKSSRGVHRRRLSNNQLAKKSLIIIVILCALFGAPNLYVFNIITLNITKEHACVPILSGYTIYYTYFVNPVLSFGLPLIIISTFSILTWINISKLGGQHTANRLEKQLTLMTTCQALTVIVSSIPNNVQFLYLTITRSYAKDPLRIVQENLFIHITNVLFYIVYISPFYIYLCLSSEVRQILKQKIYRRKNRVAILINNIL